MYHATDEDARREGKKLTVISIIVFITSFSIVPVILGASLGEVVANVSWHPALALALLVNAALYRLHPLSLRAKARPGWIGFLEAGLLMLIMDPLVFYLALHGNQSDAYLLAIGIMALGYLTASTSMLRRGFRSLVEG